MKSPIQSTAQLAAELGLSRWTVSRALNGHAGVDPKTVERITEAAKRAGFSPSVLGSGLRSGRTNLVGVCLPDLVDYFLTTKITLLQEALRGHGWNPLVQIVRQPEEENEALGLFAAMGCSGVVMVASALDDEAPGLRMLQTRKIPVVRIDPQIPSSGRSVSTDRRRGLIEAMEHLHRLGHRRLVAAGFSETSTYGRQRLAGLREGCRLLGWDLAKDVLVLPPPETGNDFEAGRILGQQILEAPGDYSAVVALNDRMAFGLLRVFEEAGIRVPGEVSVIGYDNADFAAHAVPPLATIDPQVSQLIGEAVGLLASAGRTRGKLIPPSLVLRESLGVAPVR